MISQSPENSFGSPHASIALRPTGTEDEEFLLRVYASTRREELAAIPWTDVQREAFFRMQFAAQKRAYEARYPEADHRVILSNGEMAGRIMTARTDEGIQLVDISLLPEYRNAGIGGFLIGNLLADAEREGVCVNLEVLQSNPAKHLYERLGFSKTSDHDIYSRMQWCPKNRARVDQPT
jgi:ribosomal protein S18 acetylase RimI-like enzyme